MFRELPKFSLILSLQFTKVTPAGIYLLKINNKCRSGVFIVNFEDILHLVLVFLLLTLSR